MDGCGEGRGAGSGSGSGAGAVTTAPRAAAREGQSVGGQGRGAGAEEDTRPPSNALGPLYPAEGAQRQRGGEVKMAEWQVRMERESRK